MLKPDVDFLNIFAINCERAADRRNYLSGICSLQLIHQQINKMNASQKVLCRLKCCTEFVQGSFTWSAIGTFLVRYTCVNFWLGYLPTSLLLLLSTPFDQHWGSAQWLEEWLQNRTLVQQNYAL